MIAAEDARLDRSEDSTAASAARMRTLLPIAIAARLLLLAGAFWSRSATR
jgi:hypothetical protein